MDPKWSNFAICLYIYSLYNTDWIANTEIVLDPNNSVIKRLRCTILITVTDSMAGFLAADNILTTLTIMITF